MINFSNVARQLNEQPGGNPNAGRAAFDVGAKFENALQGQILPKLNPRGRFQRPAGSVKTDVYSEHPSGNVDKNINYSAKVIRDGGTDIGGHDTGDPRAVEAGHASENAWKGTFSKVGLGGDLIDNPSGNKAAEAMAMRFGRQGRSMRDLLGDSIANRIEPGSQVLSNEQILTHYPDHARALMEHLNENKKNVLDGLLRKRSTNRQPGDRPYVDYDPQPIHRLAKLKRSDRTGLLNGRLSISNMGEEDLEELLEQYNWTMGTRDAPMRNLFLQKPNDSWETDEDDETPPWIKNTAMSIMGNNRYPGNSKSKVFESFLDQLPLLYGADINETNGRLNYSNEINNVTRTESAMDFNKLHLSEDATAMNAMAAATEKAAAGGQKQKEGTIRRREAQKSQMATQQSQNVKSGVSYASESFVELRTRKELIRMREEACYNWREELKEEGVQGMESEGQMAPGGQGMQQPEGMEQGQPGEEDELHPYVEVMPSTNFKQKEVVKQMKAAAEMQQQAQAGGELAASAGMAEQVLREDEALDNVKKQIKGEGGVFASEVPKGEPKTRKPVTRKDDGDTSQGRYRPRKPWHGKHG